MSAAASLRRLQSGSSVWRALFSAARPSTFSCSPDARPSSGLYSTTSTPADSSADPIRAAFSYCVQLVRDNDYSNYLWCIQLPKELRPAIIALRAFNTELALIEGHAKSEMLVLMRCQWWRDALNNTYKGTPPEQPAMRALAEVLRQGTPLTRYRMQRILSAREEDWTREGPPPTLDALKAIIEGTDSQLLYLQLEAAGMGNSAAAERAATHVGQASGLAALLRHPNALLKRMPADVAEGTGFNADRLNQGEGAPPELREAAKVIAKEANEHLAAARAEAAEVPAAAAPLLLSTVAAELYLRALEKANYDVFDSDLTQSGGYTPLRYNLALKWKLLRGAY